MFRMPTSVVNVSYNLGFHGFFAIPISLFHCVLFLIWTFCVTRSDILILYNYATLFDMVYQMENFLFAAHRRVFMQNAYASS